MGLFSWAAAVVISVVLSALSYVLRPKPRQRKPNFVSQEELEDPTADVGRPIPVVFGTVTIKAPNVLFFADKHQIRQSEYAANPNLTTYHMTVDYSICQGPIDAIRRIRLAEKTIWGSTAPAGFSGDQIQINDLHFNGGIDREGGIRGTIFLLPGTFTQKLAAYPASRYGETPDTTPGYRGIATAMFSNTPGDAYFIVEDGPNAPAGFYWSANAPFIPPVDFMVTRLPIGWFDSARSIGPRSSAIVSDSVSGIGIVLGPDVNPVHMIRECQTNEIWGGGIDPFAFDDIAYRQAAELFVDEHLGLSEVWTREVQLDEFINNVLDQTEMVLYVSPRSGKFTLKPIRDNTDLTTTLYFDETNSKINSASDQPEPQVLNEIVGTWTNPVNEKEEIVTRQNLAGIALANGEVLSDSRDFSGMRDAQTVSEAVARELVAASTGLKIADFDVTREGWHLAPGDVCRLGSKEHNFDDLAMRILRVNYGKPGDSWINIKATEDVFARRRPNFEALPQGEVAGPPRNFHLTAQDTAIRLNWDEPTNYGASPILAYQYQQNNGPWVTIPGGEAIRQYVVLNLLNDATYTYRLRAVNAQGPGIPTVPLTLGPSTVAPRAPGAPQSFRAFVVRSQIELSWLAPLSEGSATIIRYEYAVRIAGEPGDDVWLPIPEDHNFTFRIPGLTLNARYALKMRAVNSVDPGGETATIILNLVEGSPGYAMPPDPEGFSARAGIGLVALWWDNPFVHYANHGRTIIYRNTINDYANAVEVGQSAGISFFDDNVTADTEYWYWIVWQSNAGVLGDPSNPVSARTAVDVLAELNRVAAEIYADPFSRELLTPINPRLLPDRISARVADIRDALLFESMSQVKQDGDATAASVIVFTTDITRIDGELAVVSSGLIQVQADINNIGSSTAILALDARITQNAQGVSTNAALLVGVRSDLDNIGSSTAFLDLLSRVTTNESGISANAAALLGVRSDLDDIGSSSAFIDLRSDVTRIDGVSMANALAITQVTTQLGDLSATALQELEARVDDNEMGLARWLVKLTVGDLTGGVGLVNDGGTTRFYAAVDRFAVYSAEDESLQTIPFEISDGVVRIRVALIGDATIVVAKVEDLFLNNLDARTGQLGFARIERGNIFDLNVGNVLQSDNYTGGEDGEGWLINRLGQMVINAADVRGTLSADHIDSDVQNVRVLFNEDSGKAVQSGSVPFGLNDVISNYTYLTGAADNLGNYHAAFSIAVAKITVHPSGIPETSSILSIPHSGAADGTDSGNIKIWIRETDATTIYMAPFDTDDAARIYDLVGVRNPGASTTDPTDPTDPTDRQTQQILPGQIRLYSVRHRLPLMKTVRLRCKSGWLWHH